MRIGDCNTGVDLAVPGSDLTIETIVEVVEPARDGEPAVYRITVPERKTDPDTRRLFEELQRIGRDAQPVTLPPGPGQEFELIEAPLRRYEFDGAGPAFPAAALGRSAADARRNLEALGARDGFPAGEGGTVTEKELLENCEPHGKPLLWSWSGDRPGIGWFGCDECAVGKPGALTRYIEAPFKLIDIGPPGPAAQLLRRMAEEGQRQVDEGVAQLLAAGMDPGR